MLTAAAASGRQRGPVPAAAQLPARRGADYLLSTAELSGELGTDSAAYADDSYCASLSGQQEAPAAAAPLPAHSGHAEAGWGQGCAAVPACSSLTRALAWGQGGLPRGGAAAQSAAMATGQRPEPPGHVSGEPGAAPCSGAGQAAHLLQAVALAASAGQASLPRPLSPALADKGMEAAGVSVDSAPLCSRASSDLRAATMYDTAGMQQQPFMVIGDTDGAGFRAFRARRPHAQDSRGGPAGP